MDPGWGPPITAKATVRSGNHLLTIEDLGLPDSFFWFVEGLMPMPANRLRRLLGALGTYLRITLGLGGASRLSLEVDRIASGGRTSHFMPFLGMGNDAANGTMRLSKGELDILWSHGPNRELYRAMKEAMTRISESAGGKFMDSFLWRWPLRKILTAHPLGGCSMGNDAVTSVVNHRGEVWGYPNLYVADGAVIPTALAVNPSLTISALAERTAHWMIHDRELEA